MDQARFELAASSILADKSTWLLGQGPADAKEAIFRADLLAHPGFPFEKKAFVLPGNRGVNKNLCQ
jgi:hypothetical protein